MGFSSFFEKYAVVIFTLIGIIITQVVNFFITCVNPALATTPLCLQRALPFLKRIKVDQPELLVIIITGFVTYFYESNKNSQHNNLKKTLNNFYFQSFVTF